MKLSFRRFVLSFAAVVLAVAIGGGMASGADRQKRGPHGGTPVLVGEHHFHLELVRDAAADLFQAYVLDDHLEKYVSVYETNFTMTATFAGRTNRLDFKRVANPSDGKIPAKSSVFEGRAGWVKSATNFTGHIPIIVLNGKTFTNISFSFPKGTQHTH